MGSVGCLHEGIWAVAQWQTGTVGLLSVSHQEGVLGIVPGNKGVQQVSPDEGDVLDPHQHVQVQSAPLLEFKSVEVGDQVSRGWCLGVAKHLLPPAVAIGPGQVAPGYLFQDVGHMQRLQCVYIGGLQRLILTQILEEGQGKVHLYELMVMKNEGKLYWWMASIRYRCCHCQ